MCSVVVSVAWPLLGHLQLEEKELEKTLSFLAKSCFAAVEGVLRRQVYLWMQRLVALSSDVNWLLVEEAGSLEPRRYFLDLFVQPQLQEVVEFWGAQL